MTPEHSERTRNNWKRAIERALREGKLTTIITFDDTRYSVVLHPIEPQKPYIGQVAECRECNQQIVFVGPYWQHSGLLNPRHPGIPKE